MPDGQHSGAAIRARYLRALCDVRGASKWRIYILSLVSKVAGAGERESEMTREIYSRELSGTVQFSWIVGRGMRYCPTSPGLSSYFLFISSTNCSAGCFSLFPREWKFELYHDKARKKISDNYDKNILDLAKLAGKFLDDKKSCIGILMNDISITEVTTL